jgi:hypothetical protein
VRHQRRKNAQADELLIQDIHIANDLFPRDERLRASAAISFDAVAIRVFEKRRVVVLPIVWARPRLSVVSPAVPESGRMKAIHTLAGGCSKADMQTRSTLIRNGLFRREYPKLDGFVAISD